MSAAYELEKWVWDDGDFDRMGWHDATIHAIAFGATDFELSLDVDYIFAWVKPAEGEKNFRFWVAPCTLVFQNVYDVRLEAMGCGGPLIEVNELRRDDPRRPKNAEFIGCELEWQWTFDGHHGELGFRSVGFTLYVRRAPVLLDAQVLDLAERGGYSFERGKSA